MHVIVKNVLLLLLVTYYTMCLNNRIYCLCSPIGKSDFELTPQEPFMS